MESMKKDTLLHPTKHQKHRIAAASAAVFFMILLAVAAFPLCHRLRRPTVICLASWSEDPPAGGITYNTWQALSVPTQITRIGGDYFIVDCYHNQILTSPSLDTPLTEWLVLTDQINRGHTIAGDGVVYLADDTENNRILIFEKKDGVFYQTQSFENIGIRPHYVIYDEASERFYALSSMTGELYVFFRPQKDSSAVALEKVLSIPELNNIYVRSFTIAGDDIFFVSGNSSIIRADKKELNILETWPVPSEIAGMVQLTKIQNYFYITVSTDLYGNQDYATLLRVKDLADLESGNWEDIYDSFIGGGTPYYISSFDGHFYLTEHRIPGHGIWQFDVEDDQFTQIRTLFP